MGGAHILLIAQPLGFGKAAAQLPKISPKKMTIKNTSTIPALGITRRKS